MIANYHTHTWRCNHAQEIEEDYVQAALDRGLETLGFSDHTPYCFPAGYYSTFRMRPEELEDYCEAVLKLRKQYGHRLHIPLGVELEYYPAYFDETLAMLRDSPLEYFILGQHFVGSEFQEHYCALMTEDTRILERYCDQVIEALHTGLFSYLAHPDLLHFLGRDRDYVQQMRRVCRSAKGCGIPLEINLLGIELGRHYPDCRFWEAAGEEGCAVILGCDAHDPQSLRDRSPEARACELAAKYSLRVQDTVPLLPIR